MSLDGFEGQINVLDRKNDERFWSKGDPVVTFSFYDGELPYEIWQNDDKVEKGKISSSKPLIIKYGTNYIPGDSLGSVCIGCVIDYMYDADKLRIELSRDIEHFCRMTGRCLSRMNHAFLSWFSTSLIKVVLL